MGKPEIFRSSFASLLGSYLLAVPTGLVTVIAAGTASAGHLFAAQWTNTTKNALIRYVGARFVTTTAFGAAQEVGCELLRTTVYSAPHTGGTAVTLAAMNKLRSVEGDSLFNDMRVATTGALTNGTQTIDTQPLGSCSGWSSAAGVTIAKEALFDANDALNPDAPNVLNGGMPLRSPLVLAANEGFIVRNTVLMGATGVGRWQFYIGWDEVLP
jgi:hypothetical protein